MKRKLMILLTIVSIFALCITTNATVDTMSAKIEKQKDSIKAYQEIEKAIKSKSDKSLSKYAGAYIDDNGNLNILIAGKNNDDIDTFGKSAKLNTVIYHDAVLTINELLNLKNSIDNSVENLRNKGIIITECVLNEEENCIYLYVENLDQQKIDILKDTFNSDAIVIKNSNDVIQPCYSLNAPGHFIDFFSGSTSLFGGTLTFWAKDSNGNPGVVAFGHSMKVGYITYFGTVDKVAFSGKCDASFIKQTNSNATPSAKIYFDTASRISNVVFSTMPQGTSVAVARGTSQSYSWDSITSTSASGLVGTTWITDMYTTNNSLTAGDSGSPLLYQASTFAYGLLGQASGVGLSGSYFVKFSNVYSGLGLSSYTIEP